MDSGRVEKQGVGVASVTPSPGSTRREAMAIVAAFGAVWLVWGSTYLAIAWAVETIPPLLLIGVRCTVAGAVLYAWGRVRGGRRPSAEDWRVAAVAGVLLFVTGQAVLAWAETRIPSGAASLLVATEPLFIAFLAWRGGALTGAPAATPAPGAVMALVAGFVGVGLLTTPGTGGGLDAVGAAAALVASLSWSLGVFRARSRSGIPAAQNAGMQLLTAGAVLLALAVGAGDTRALTASAVSLRSLAALGYLIVFGSLVAFGAYVWLLDRVGPTRLSTHAYVNPLVAIVLGIGLNGETATVGLLLASALILGAVALLLRAQREGAAALGARSERRTWRLRWAGGPRQARRGGRLRARAVTGD